MATSKNFIVKNGLEVGGQEVIDSSGVVTSAALGGQTLGTTDSPTFAGLTVDTDTLYVDAANNRIGIGTTSPSAKLGVNATAPDFTFLQSDVVKFRSGVSGVTNGGVTGSTSGDYFARTTGGKMLFSVDDGVTAHAIIDSSGKVGIGTTTPSATLDVSGTLNLDVGFPIGNYNLGIGTNVFSSLITGAVNNTAFGYNALANATTSDYNAAFGDNTLRDNTTGLENTAIGSGALTRNIGGSDNTAVGFASLDHNTSGTHNTTLGAFSGSAITTGKYNTAVGVSALVNATIGWSNVAVGDEAGRGVTEGEYNTIVGSIAGYALTTGDTNTFVGNYAGGAITTGSNNVIIGSYSGNQSGLDIRTANNFIVLSDGGGAPRIVVDSTGNVGIGTTSPLNPLHVKQSGGTHLAILETSYSTDRAGRGQLSWRDAGNITGAIWTEYDGSQVSMRFGNLYNSGYTTNTSMIIRGGGNVGIGHSSPTSKLSIVGDGGLNNYSGVLGIENTDGDPWASISLTDDIDAATAASNYYLIGRGSSHTNRHLSLHIPTAADYGSGAQPKIIFASTGADTLFSVEASTGNAFHKGNVGIGTQSPAYTFDLLSPTAGYIARFKSSGNYGGVIADAGSSAGSPGGGYFDVQKYGSRVGLLSVSGAVKGNAETNLSVFAETGKQIEFATNGLATPKVTIDTSGNVGIGTSSVTNKLEVDGGSASTRLRVSTTNPGSAVAGIILANSSKTAFNDGIDINHGGGVTNFSNLSGSAQLSIDMSNSRVGIGTTSPGYKLDVAGNTRSEAYSSKYVLSYTVPAGTYNTGSWYGVTDRAAIANLGYGDGIYIFRIFDDTYGAGGGNYFVNYMSEPFWFYNVGSNGGKTFEFRISPVAMGHAANGFPTNYIKLRLKENYSGVPHEIQWSPSATNLTLDGTGGKTVTIQMYKWGGE